MILQGYFIYSNDPGAQIHWRNVYGVLMKAQLDARETTGIVYNTTNSLSYLTEIFNNDSNYQPHNVNMQRVSA
jgi:hypothetical protein